MSLASSTDPKSLTRFTNFRSFLRVRPFINKESEKVPEQSKVPRPVLDVDPKAPQTVVVLDPTNKFKPKKNATFNVDNDVLWSFVDTIEQPGAQPMPPHADQSAMYDAFVKPVLPSIGDGFSTTFVVTGGADTGKSHNMFASASDDWGTEKGGLMGRFAIDLFETLEAVKRDNSTQRVEVEVTDVSGETFGDMLVKKGTKTAAMAEEMKVLQDATEGTYLSNSTRVCVANAEELENTVKTAIKLQKKKKHSIIVTIRIEETYRFTDPNAADPDHPMNQDVSKSRRFTVMFALLRNLSPSFKRCVEMACERDALEKPTIKIPVRESAVTKLLADIFNGTCNVSFLTCVSPFYGDVKESTLMVEMAAKLSKIRTNPRHNHDSAMLEMRKLSDEVRNLNTAVANESQAILVVQEELNARQIALEAAEEQNAKQAEELAAAHDQKKRMGAMESVAWMMVKVANEKKKREIAALELEIKETNETTDQTDDDRQRIMAEQSDTLDSIAKIEKEIITARKNNEPVAQERKEWKSFEDEVLHMEEMVNSAPDDRLKMVEERRAEAAEVKKELNTLEGDRDILGEKLSSVKAKVCEVQPIHDGKLAKENKLKASELKVKEQQDEIKKLEEEIARLEQDNIKIQQDIDNLPKGCCIAM